MIRYILTTIGPREPHCRSFVDASAAIKAWLNEFPYEVPQDDWKLWLESLRESGHCTFYNDDLPGDHLQVATICRVEIY